MSAKGIRTVALWLALLAGPATAVIAQPEVFTATLTPSEGVGMMVSTWLPQPAAGQRCAQTGVG